MATRDRYVRILVGFAERLREAGLSLEAIGLVFLIYTLSLKRSIPGCLRIGVGGLAEALGFTVAKTERLLKEHERQGAVRVDRKVRLIYIVGAVEADGPRTKQTVVAFYRDWRELPNCPLKTEIGAAIVGVLNQADASLRAEWDYQLESCAKTHAKSYAKTDTDTSVTPIPPSEIRVPDTEEPQPLSTSDDLRPFLSAVSRVGLPPLAAAADCLTDQECSELRAIGLETWGRRLEAHSGRSPRKPQRREGQRPSRMNAPGKGWRQASCLSRARTQSSVSGQSHAKEPEGSSSVGGVLDKHGFNGVGSVPEALIAFRQMASPKGYRFVIRGNPLPGLPKRHVTDFSRDVPPVIALDTALEGQTLTSEVLKGLAKPVLHQFGISPTYERIGTAESLRHGVRAASGQLIHDEMCRRYVLVLNGLVGASRGCLISKLGLNDSPRADQRGWRARLTREAGRGGRLGCGDGN